MVSHDGETLRASDVSQDIGAAMDGTFGEVTPERAKADVVASEEDEVGGKRVDVGNDAAQKRSFGELIEVDVADLGDAEVVKSVRQVVDGDSADGDADLVARDLAGVERHAAGSNRGAEQKPAAGEKGLFLCHREIGEISGHSP